MRVGVLLALAAAVAAQDATHWVERLSTGDLAARREAAYALWHLADPSAAAALAGAVAADDEYLRTTAAKALAKLGDGARAGVPRLAELLADEREAVRREAATLLYRLGPLAAGAVEPLTAALASEDPIVRATAPACLGNAAGAAKSALPELETLLDDHDAQVREWAAYAIARIDPHVALTDTREPILVAVLSALNADPAKMRPESMPRVAALLGHEAEQVRTGAAVVLGTALLFRERLFHDGVGDFAPLLLDRYETESSSQARIWLTYALGRLPGAAEQIVPLLVEATRSSDFAVARQSVVSLGELFASAGPVARAAAPRVAEALRHPDVQMRTAAAYAFAGLDSAPPAVVDALAAALRDDAYEVRSAAAWSLARAAPERALPHLVEALKSTRDLQTRRAYASALATLGTAAAAAKDDLDNLLVEAEHLVANAAYARAAVSEDVPE